MRREKIELQDLAVFLRDAAYGDGQTHKISWSLSIIHPMTNDGEIGYSGGIWTAGEAKHAVSIQFSYSQSAGVYNFKMWKDRNEIRHRFAGDKPAFEEFKKIVTGAFGIEELYKSQRNGA